MILRNRVKSDPVQIFVDKWPQFSVVFCKPFYKQENDRFRNIFVFATNEAALEETIRKSSLIDWTRNQQFPHGDIEKNGIGEKCALQENISVSSDETGRHIQASSYRQVRPIHVNHIIGQCIILGFLFINRKAFAHKSHLLCSASVRESR